MMKKEVDIWGWAETNVHWTEKLMGIAKSMGHKVFEQMTLVAGGSANLAGCYQQGVTCTGIVGNIVGHIIASGTDESGSGRWSY
eukprot:12894285-Ditylum_brightwellii.AAC.1